MPYIREKFKNVQAEIIAIGDEILVGQTTDTNSTFIASQLSANGVFVKQKRVIADEEDSITDALNGIHPNTKLVFMTGGLGPTKDDITKRTLMKYFGGELIYHPEVYDHIVKLFAAFNRVPNKMNKEQALLPSSCTPLNNDWGTAPGMRFQKGDTYYFSIPGVPYEAEGVVEHEIIPWINENLQNGTVVHHTLLTQGVPESELAEQLADWENALPLKLKLAYLPSPGIVKLRLSVYEGDKLEAEKLVKREAKKAINILGNVVFGEGNQKLEEIIGLSLLKEKATVSTAESCTGGLIAHILTGVSGCSAYFNGGVVSYSNASKTELLGVDPLTIEKHGAVSKEVAMQMAAGAKKKFKTEYAVATTGVAGPTGGSLEKPVGMVWIAVASPDGVKAKCFYFGKNRKRNIKKAALTSLDLLRREVQKIK